MGLREYPISVHTPEQKKSRLGCIETNAFIYDEKLWIRGEMMQPPVEYKCHAMMTGESKVFESGKSVFPVNVSVYVEPETTMQVDETLTVHEGRDVT